MDNHKNTTSVFVLLSELFKSIDGKRRKQFYFLLVITFIASLAEVISLSAIIPFIAILTKPESIFALPLISQVSFYFGITQPQDLVLPITITFIIAILLSGALRLYLVWLSIQLTSSVGVDLSIDVFRRTLYQPYSIHVSRSSSEVISGITQKVLSATRVLMSTVTVITAFVLFTAILLTLFVVDPMVAAVAVFGFGAGYILIAKLVHSRLVLNSQHISREQTQVVKALQEGLGAIRDVLIDNTQQIYCETYRKSIVCLQKANAENSFLNQSPRFLMEAIGMVLITLLAWFINLQSGGLANSLPVLGALALGAQRLLPLLQQLYANWSNVTSSQASLLDVLGLLKQPLPTNHNQNDRSPQSFENEIRFENLNFQYTENSQFSLSNINLVIKKGTRIGLIGRTGSGKSTLLDLFMGLLTQNSGHITIDDSALNDLNRKNWQATIAHVPQNIFLADSSIAENIAFGVPKEKIDMSRVKKAAEIAQISEFIEKEGYYASVGEQGICLSGGQRQRIGIARALYKEASVLVFDEATSALDTRTEKLLMESIESLDKNLTIIMIAHRMSTLKNCDKIVQFDNGHILAENTYEFFTE